VYANSLVSLMDKAASPLVEASQLHLRLLGMPYTAEAEMQNTETITRLIDAQAEAIEISNEVAKVQQNWQLNDTAAMTITGSAPPDEASRAGDTEAKPLPVAAPPAGKPGDVPTKEDNVQGDPKPRDEASRAGDTEAKPLPVAALPAGKPGDVPTKEDNVQGDPKPRDGQQKEGAECPHDLIFCL